MILKLWAWLVSLMTALLFISFYAHWHFALGTTQLQLQKQAQIAADSLALTMSQAALEKDIESLGIYLDAMMSRGDFEELKFTLADGMVAITRSKSEYTDQQSSTPEWFRDYFSLNTGRAFSEVTSGWHRVGFLEVRTATDETEAANWKLLNSLVNAYLFLMLLSAGGVYWLLHRKRAHFHPHPKN